MRWLDGITNGLKLNGYEFEQTPGDSEGQRSLMSVVLGLQRVGHDRAIE